MTAPEPNSASVGSPGRRPRRRSGLGPAVIVSLALHAAGATALTVGAWTVSTAGTGVGDVGQGVPASVVELSAPPPAAPRPDPQLPYRESSVTTLVLPGDGPGSAPAPDAPTLTGARTAASGATLTGISSATPQTTLRADTAAAPGALFAGVGAAAARSVVYVVDASGPMVASLPEVIAELQASVERLKPTQRFSVIAFRRTPDGGGVESFAAAPVRATDQARRELASWLAALRPAGRSNPLDGLTSALAMKPDAVFLLSRSIERSGGGVWDLGKDRTLAELDRLNPRNASGARPVAIRTIQFLDEDPTGTMQAIAREHAGDDAAAQGAGAYTVIRRAGELSPPSPDPRP